MRFFFSGDASFMVWIILIGVAVVIIAAVLNAVSDDASVSGLNGAFVALGTLQGRNLAEIVAAVGEPNVSSRSGDGSQLCTWGSASVGMQSYQISLLFRDGICEGVVGEQTVRA